MYRSRSASALPWGNVPTTASSLPPLASPTHPHSSTRPPPRSLLHLAPRPPALSIVPGYQDVPAAAESTTFALFERRRSEEAVVLRELPAAVEYWQTAGIGGNLAVRWGRGFLSLEMAGVKEECKGSCCKPWTSPPPFLTPRPGDLDSPWFPTRGHLANCPLSSSSSSSPSSSTSAVLIKPLPKPT